MKLSYSALLFSIIVCLTLSKVQAQDHDHDHRSHKMEHTDLPNEIGAAAGLVYDFSEKMIGVGLHLHYTRMLKDKLESLGFGGGFEAVILDHMHYNLSVMAVYRPIHPLWFSLGPGVTFFAEEKEAKFSVHVETGYEFEVKILHIGPVLEYAFAGNDHHFMVGLHVGFPF